MVVIGVKLKNIQIFHSSREKYFFGMIKRKYSQIFGQYDSTRVVYLTILYSNP